MTTWTTTITTTVTTTTSRTSTTTITSTITSTKTSTTSAPISAVITGSFVVSLGAGDPEAFAQDPLVITSLKNALMTISGVDAKYIEITIIVSSNSRKRRLQSGGTSVTVEYEISIPEEDGSAAYDLAAVEADLASPASDFTAALDAELDAVNLKVAYNA